MEPQIIDYYNDIPGGSATCINVIDKMNEELETLQNKYDELQEKYDKIIKQPKILFNSIDVFNETQEEMYLNIRKTIDECFNNRESLRNYGIMGSNLGGDWRINLLNCIERELNKITNDQYFSYHNSGEIMEPIVCIFRGRESPHWIKIFDALTTEDFKDIFFDNIKNYIELVTVDKYAVFKCTKCGVIFQYITESNQCTDCGGY